MYTKAWHSSMLPFSLPVKAWKSWKESELALVAQLLSELCPAVVMLRGCRKRARMLAFPLWSWEDRASLRAAPSLWHTEPRKAPPCLHRCLSGIAFGVASRAISQPVSLSVCFWREPASLGSLRGFPCCWGSSQVEGWLVSAVELCSGHGGGSLSCFTS